MRSGSVFVPLTTEPAGIQIAARHKASDGGCGPEAPTNHIAASRVNVDDTFRGREQSPERLGLTKYTKQSLNSLYKIYAAQHSKFVRSADEGSDDGTLQPPSCDHGDSDLALLMNVEPNLGYLDPFSGDDALFLTLFYDQRFSGSVSYHGALFDSDLHNQIEDGDELGLGAFPTSAHLAEEYALSPPVLPFEWSSSDLKDPAFHYHTLPEHEKRGEQAFKAPSEASKGRPAGKKWLTGEPNQKYCRPFRHSYGKPKAYAHDITSGAELDSPCLDGWNIESSESAEDGALACTYPGRTDADPEMLLQPETRPISYEQLIAEVKGIYTGLVMVEAKCIDIAERQSVAAAEENGPGKRLRSKNDQWQSLIALHKQLLHEHHDFLLASQHPFTSVALSRLASKYSMPARFWCQGIYASLEVPRHRTPESMDHMLPFGYIAYSLMALLYETVPTFDDIWIECLGDLGRYRTTNEDDEPKDREVCSNVTEFWYNKALDHTPGGRLYHHLAILARPDTLEQLFLYTKSLTCTTPSEFARSSVMALFDPIVQSRLSALGPNFIRAHAMHFTSIWPNLYGPSCLCDERHWQIKKIAQLLLKNYLFSGHHSLIESCYSGNWTTAAVIDDGCAHEILFILQPRKERMLWFRYPRASPNRWIRFDKGTNKFTTTEIVGVEAATETKPRPTSYEQKTVISQSGTAQNFPRTVRVALITSLDAFLKRYCASEPADMLDAEASAQRAAPEADYHTAANDNVPIAGITPEQVRLKGFVLQGQLFNKSENWVMPSSVGIDEDQYLDLTSVAKARVERILRLAQQIVSSLQPILLLALALSGVSCLPTVNGSPISNSGTTSESSDMKPLVSLLFLLENSLYVAFGAVALILTRSVAVKKGPILAWGCMMYMAAYGWWAVREDGTAPPILLVALLGFWSCSAFRYSIAIFKTFKCPERVSLMAFVLAAILDMAVVSFMTPQGAPIPQSALLSLSLPAMSLSLHLIGCFRDQHVLPLLDHVQDTESFGHEGVHLRERHCQQPRIAFEADNSRFRLNGSLLEEDSTRIWQYDN